MNRNISKIFGEADYAELLAQVKSRIREARVRAGLAANLPQPVAEYALRGLKKPIGVSEYQLTRALTDDLKPSLPTVEEIEREIVESGMLEGGGG